jgi:hypothetical protein
MKVFADSGSSLVLAISVQRMREGIGNTVPRKPKQTKSRQHARARQKRPLRLLPNRQVQPDIVTSSKMYSPKGLSALLQSPVVRAAPTKGCRGPSEPIIATKTCTGGLSSAAAISPQHHFLVRF